MQYKEIIATLDSLSKGVDPTTGADVSDATYRSAHVTDALSAASGLLRAAISADRQEATNSLRTARPAHAGKRWTEAEDEQLCREFEAGLQVIEIAAAHGRSRNGITARLVHLGRLDATHSKTRLRGITAHHHLS